jgi:BASS family bile acid:Na+ symporter
LLGALAIRRFLGPRLTESGSTLDGLSVAVLMVFAIPLMDGVVARGMAEPWKLAGFAAGAFAGMLLCNLVMAVITLPFLDRRSALTAGYCSWWPAQCAPDGGAAGDGRSRHLPVHRRGAGPDLLIPTLLQPLYRRWLPSPA